MLRPCHSLSGFICVHLRFLFLKAKLAAGNHLSAAGESRERPSQSCVQAAHCCAGFTATNRVWDFSRLQYRWSWFAANVRIRTAIEPTDAQYQSRDARRLLVWIKV